MIDLVAMNLIPHKTKAKNRNGDVLVFIGVDARATGLTHVWSKGIEIYWTMSDGHYNDNGRDNGYDVVAVSQPWIPRVGDIVRAFGCIKNTDSGTARSCDGLMDYTITEVKESGNWFEVKEDPGSTAFLAHRNALKLRQRPASWSRI